MREMSHRPPEPSPEQPVPEEIQGEFQGTHWREAETGAGPKAELPTLSRGEAQSQVDRFFREHPVHGLAVQVHQNSENKLLMILTCGSFNLGGWQEEAGKDWWKVSPAGSDQFGTLAEVLPLLERQLGKSMGWYN